MASHPASGQLPELRPKQTAALSIGLGDRHRITPTAKSSGKNVSNACNACQRYRTKCDGNSPCSTCVAHGRDCILDKTQDGRRGRKRMLDELSSKADALDTLMDVLRTTPKRSAQELFELVRGGATTEEIVQHAEHLLERDRVVNLQSHPSRTKLSIASLTDDTPIRVPAAPWTDIVNDESAVSHLITVYFTWQHCGYPSVDRDLFITAMKSMQLSSIYCSPFLVNSMLAAACMHTDHPAVFDVPGDLSSRGQHFIEEAIRLWALEGGKVTLTSLQALPALIASLIALGKDRVALLYVHQMTAICAELVAEVKKCLKQSTPPDAYTTDEFWRSFRLGVWSAYICQVTVAVNWVKSLNPHAPTIGRPYSNEEMRITAPWQPYPQPGQTSFICFPYAEHNERFSLFEILSDTMPLLLGDQNEDSPLRGGRALSNDIKLNLVRKVVDQLLLWEHSLPPNVKIDYEAIAGSNPASPVIDLHLVSLVHHVTVNSVLLRCTILPTDLPEVGEASSRVILASRKIADLFEWLQQTIGLKDFSVYQVQAASVPAYILLELLDRPGVPQIMHTLIVVLSAASQRWLLARGIIRTLWMTLLDRRLDKVLDEATVSVLKGGAIDGWGLEDHRLFVSCGYPNYARLNESGFGYEATGDLLERWSRLEAGERLEQ